MKLPVPSIVATAVALLALTGCAHDHEDTSASLEALAPSAAPPSQVSRPLATLPTDLGGAGSVRVRTYADGVRQQVQLEDSVTGLPRNVLTIVARTRQLDSLDEAVPLEKPSEPAIRSEIASAFPRIAMHIVERPSGNAYGPYGLAIGRAAGDARCVFFWQWIDAEHVPQDAGISGPLSIRASLCRKGTSFDAIAAALDGLRLTRVADSWPDAIVPVAIHDAPRRRTAHRPISPIDRARAVGEDATIMHYHSLGAQRPLAAPTRFVSDLPPEALSGPKLASKQD